MVRSGGPAGRADCCGILCMLAFGDSHISGQGMWGMGKAQLGRWQDVVCPHLLVHTVGICSTQPGHMASTRQDAEALQRAQDCRNRMCTCR